MMNKTIKLLTTITLLLASLGAQAAWDVRVDKDDFEGTTQVFVSSPWAKPMSPMASPYDGTRSTLSVGCENGKEWAYLYFTKKPNLTYATDRITGFDYFKFPIMFDGKKDTASMSHAWGGSFISFKHDKWATDKMSTSKEMKIKLSWYGNEGVVFKYDLRGATAALKEMRSKCKKK